MSEYWDQETDVAQSDVCQCSPGNKEPASIEDDDPVIKTKYITLNDGTPVLGENYTEPCKEYQKLPHWLLRVPRFYFYYLLF